MGEARLARLRAAAAADQARRARSCGAARGTAAAHQPVAAMRRPARCGSRVTSIASGRVRGGRIDGSRRASMVLPVPGGPVRRTLWPPAAASAAPRSARRGRARRRGRGRLARRRDSAARSAASGRGARRRPAGRRPRAALDGASDLEVVDERRLARPRRAGRQRAQARRARASATASAPAAGPQLAVSESSPKTARRSSARRAPGRWRRARRRAIGRSKPEPPLRRCAGARLAVMRRSGNSKPGVEQRGADALARLADGGVAEPDDGEGGQALADVDLDGRPGRCRGRRWRRCAHGRACGRTVGGRVRPVGREPCQFARFRDSAARPSRERCDGREDVLRRHVARLRSPPCPPICATDSAVPARTSPPRISSGSGYELVARNHRTRFGEIDLVVRDGATLVFCEVKTRRAGRGSPWDALGAGKQGQVRAMARAYLAEERRPPARRRSCASTRSAWSSTRAADSSRLDHLEGAF